jgi:acyl carrier protein
MADQDGRNFMASEIYESLSSFIAKQILKQPDRVITPDEPIISSGLIDSFNLVDLSLHIEKAFGVLIDDTELNRETFDTLTQLTQLVQSRL